MKKTFVISLIIEFLLGISIISAQNTTEFTQVEHQTIYRIKVDEYQTVELIEFKNGDFKGSLIHRVNKTNRKGIAKDSIVQKIKIPNQMVKSIMTDLNKGGIESLIDCEKIEDCIIGLDGSTIQFQAMRSDYENIASYWQLTSDYYYKQNNVAVPKEVMKARKLLTFINNRFNLNKQFKNFLDRLPHGNYSYGMIIMTKRRG